MRVIEGYSSYQINRQGDVYSSLTNKILKPGTYQNGYKYVQIRSDNGELKNERIHILVAKAYVPNPDSLPQVHHKDEDKQNNLDTNLEWCTGFYNQQQSAYKKHKAVEMLDLSSNVIQTFESIKDAATFVGCTSGMISKVCKGDRITTANYKWRYLNNDEN